MSYVKSRNPDHKILYQVTVDQEHCAHVLNQPVSILKAWEVGLEHSDLSLCVRTQG